MAKHLLGTHNNQQKNERVKDRLSNLQRQRIRPVLSPSLPAGSTGKTNTPYVYVVPVIDRHRRGRYQDAHACCALQGNDACLAGVFEAAITRGRG